MAVCRCLWGSVLAEADMPLWAKAGGPAEGLVQAELRRLLRRPRLQPERPLSGWRQAEGDPGLGLLHCGGPGAPPQRGSVLVRRAEQKWHCHQAGWRLLRTKQWKPIHELGKVKPIYLTICLLCVCLGLYECIDLVVCGCSSFYTWEDCVCAFDCANWSAALKSQKSWEDRILWTAYKVCNEYLSLFIFARFRYFNVSSPLLLWVSATCGASLRHATQRAKGGGGGVR